MFQKSRMLALVLSAAGLVIPTAARAQDGYGYSGGRSYYYDSRSPYTDRRDAREWRDHERREWREHEWREHERREWREREWREHERWEHRYYRDGYAPGLYFYYGR